MAQNEYYLMHHGVKGMKWGVRRTPAQLGYKPTAGSRIKTKLNDQSLSAKRQPLPKLLWLSALLTQRTKWLTIRKFLPPVKMQ